MDVLTQAGSLSSRAGREREIIFGEKNLLGLPIDELRKFEEDISVIFQEPMTALSPLHPVGRQLAEAVLVHEPDVSRKDAWDRAVEWR